MRCRQRTHEPAAAGGAKSPTWTSRDASASGHPLRDVMVTCSYRYGQCSAAAFPEPKRQRHYDQQQDREGGGPRNVRPSVSGVRSFSGYRRARDARWPEVRPGRPRSLRARRASWRSGRPCRCARANVRSREGRSVPHQRPRSCGRCALRPSASRQRCPAMLATSSERSPRGRCSAAPQSGCSKPRRPHG